MNNERRAEIFNEEIQKHPAYVENLIAANKVEGATLHLSIPIFHDEQQRAAINILKDVTPIAERRIQEEEHDR